MAHTQAPAPRQSGDKLWPATGALYDTRQYKAVDYVSTRNAPGARLRDEPPPGVVQRRRSRCRVVVDQPFGHEALHHFREALVRDQEPLRAVLVHLAEGGRGAVPLRQPREHALARLLEVRVLPLLGCWLRHGPPTGRQPPAGGSMWPPNL